MVVLQQVKTGTYLHEYDRDNIINLKYMEGQSDLHIQWNYWISFNEMDAFNGCVKITYKLGGWKKKRSEKIQGASETNEG